MAHVFRAKSFIADATALDNTQTDGRGNDSMAKLVEDYLTAQDDDTGSGATDIDQIFSISSCKLSGDRIFVLAVIEDDVASG